MHKLSEKLSKQAINSAALAECARELHAIEMELYDKSSSVLTHEYNFKKSFDKQDETFHEKIFGFYKEIEQLKKLWFTVAEQLQIFNNDEARSFWRLYTGNEENTTLYTEARLIFNAASSEYELNEHYKLIYKSDIIKLLNYAPGRQRIARFVDNIKKTSTRKDFKFVIEQGEYAILTDYLQPVNAFSATQSSSSIEKMKFCQGNNYAELREAYKDKGNKVYGKTQIETLTLHIPGFSLSILFGVKNDKACLFFSQTYFALFHELGHANRVFRGAMRENYIIPDIFNAFYTVDIPNKPNAISYGEELWNVLLAKNNDKLLSEATGNPVRLSYKSCPLKIQNNKIALADSAWKTDVFTSELFNVQLFLGKRDFSNVEFNEEETPLLKLFSKNNSFVFSQAKIILNIKNSNLTRSKFYFSDLQKTTITASNINQSSFIKVNLSEAIIKFSDLTNCDFSEATLKDAEISNTNLSHSNFKNADLRGLKIGPEIDVTHANFDGANLEGVLPATLNSLVLDKKITVNEAIMFFSQCNPILKELSDERGYSQKQADEAVLKIFWHNAITIDKLRYLYNYVIRFRTIDELLEFLAQCDNILTMLSDESKLLTINQIEKIISLDRLSDTKNLLSFIDQNESIRLALYAKEFSINDVLEKREEKKVSCYAIIQEWQTYFRKAVQLPINSL